MGEIGEKGREGEVGIDYSCAICEIGGRKGKGVGGKRVADEEGEERMVALKRENQEEEMEGRYRQEDKQLRKGVANLGNERQGVKKKGER